MRKIIKTVTIFLAIILAILVIVFCYFFVGKAVVPQKITWGVDFSQMQAQSLGLNWKEVYLAIIDDLGAKNIKIHTQWDWIEGQQSNYYFDDIDWQLARAKENGVKIIYVVGMKSGRWPECHIPTWVDNLSDDPEGTPQKDATLDYIKTVIQKYKGNDAIISWQVENEPLFYFGSCPKWYYKDTSFLQQEVALVKSLDSSRKIIISDTGENSTWFGAAKIGDVVGITMYRDVWFHISDTFGLSFHYLFPPVYYSRKALLINKIFGKDVICIELQAEPWVSKPFYDVPLAEQLKTMSLEILKNNIEYAKETGLDKFYFWGVEWWYWMKTVQNQPAMWNEVKVLLNK